MSRYVRIYYGPYEEFFTKSHRPQKVRGLTDALLKHGYRVHLIPVDYVNCCIIEVLGVEVFRCNIRNLCLNVPQEDDIVCQRAVAAVKDASRRLRRANSHFWMHTVFKQILVRRNDVFPKQTWPFEIAIQPLTPVEDCIECCKILVTKRKEPREQVAQDIDVTCTVKEDDEPKKGALKANEAVITKVDTILGDEPTVEDEGFNQTDMEFIEQGYEGDLDSVKTKDTGAKEAETQVEEEVVAIKIEDTEINTNKPDSKRFVSINIKEPHEIDTQH